MQLQTIDANLVVVRLDPSERIPDKVWNSPFLSITRTDEELSIICEESYYTGSGRLETGYGLIKIVGSLNFNMSGVLSSLLDPLGRAGISVLSISTYDTDYILVKNNKLLKAGKILAKLPEVEIV